MLKINLDKTNGIATLEPVGTLSKEDFGKVAGVIDPYIENTGDV